MQPIKAILIDDEKHARESLQSLLELYCPEVKVIAEAATVDEGVKWINQLLPDVVFLDISIGEETGFELLEKIQPVTFHLIFTTAFSEYAIKAFRVNALDYLLKPIEPQQLQDAISKIKVTKPINRIQQQLAQLTQTLNLNQIKKITISTSEGMTFLEVDKIVNIIGSSNYSTFHMENEETVIASKSLKHFESLLPSHDFYRCHQSHLINLNFVKKIITKDGDRIELSNGQFIPLAKKRKVGFLKKLNVRMRN